MTPRHPRPQQTTAVAILAILLTLSPLAIAHSQPPSLSLPAHDPLNAPPSTPPPPDGPRHGQTATPYAYTSATTDPDNDTLRYCFDWGDGTTTWTQPLPSGATATATHAWDTKGYFLIRVKAQDDSGQDSPWSDAHELNCSGPYLTIANTTAGHGLSLTVTNIGEQPADNGSIQATITGGLWIHPRTTTLSLPTLLPGQSTTQTLHPIGLGLGLTTTLPNITLTLTADHCRPRIRHIHARIIGGHIHTVTDAWDTTETSPGYLIYTPMISTLTLLMDANDTIEHTWTSDYKPALSSYLLDDGSLLRTALPRVNTRFWGGGIGGRVERYDWNGTLTWSFDYTTTDHCLHHDIALLPNGNILMIAWEYKSAADAAAAGRDPSTLPYGELWPDHLIEVRPTGPTSGDIVWQWHIWDHLIQDYDPTKANYGTVADHPELVDINYGSRFFADWMHTNRVDYNPALDQIMISVHGFSELWIIDHSTTTQEAAGHTGGRSGHGGDLLYRWGNPRTYRHGTEQDQQLYGQHDAQWIAPGLPGAGDILIFNNGIGRPDGPYTTIDEITPPLQPDGTYALEPGSAYAPQAPTWRYIAPTPTSFFAINLGSAQRLPNGNTLICDGPAGRFFEVTPEHETIWSYLNHIPAELGNEVFTAHRYPPDYPGLRQLFH